MYKLQIRDGIDSIDFVGDQSNTFFLIDESFEMGDIDYQEKDTGYVAEWGHAINARAYGPREVSFSIAIRGNTRSDVVASIDRLFRMSARALTNRHFSGGSYSSSYSYNPEPGKVVPGQQGLQLIIQYGDSNSANVVGEFGQTYSDDKNINFYVISMDVSGLNLLSSEVSMQLAGSSAVYGVDISLVVSAFGYGGPIKIAVPAGTGDYGFTALPSPIASSPYNFGARFTVPSASIPGSGEALTQFTMNVHKNSGTGSGDGVIIARDAGKSLANCPSVFLRSSDRAIIGMTTAIVPVGYDTSTNNYYDIELLALNPVQLRYRTNGGTWSSTVTPTAFEVVQVNSSFGFFVVTEDFSDRGTVGQIGRSFASQYFYAPRSPVNLASDYNGFISDSGSVVQICRIAVPSGIHGRYKVMFGVGSDVTMSYRMRVSLLTNQYTVPGYNGNWASHPNAIKYGTLDLGVIDFSPLASPQSMIPGGVLQMEIMIYGRIEDSVYTGTVTPYGVFFIPCGDERSFIRAKWTVVSTWDGFQIISNFDPRSPLIGMVNREYRGSFNSASINSQVSALDQTVEGSPITLVPGVDNTILVIPLFSVSSDYRTGLPTSGIGTGTTTMSIRPAYFVAR